MTASCDSKITYIDGDVGIDRVYGAACRRSLFIYGCVIKKHMCRMVQLLYQPLEVFRIDRVQIGVFHGNLTAAHQIGERPIHVDHAVR